MKNIVLILMLLTYGVSWGQDSIVFTDYDEYKNYIFGQLPNDLMPTGFLLDKNGLITPEDWQKFEVNQDNNIEMAYNLNHWFELYKYLNFAKTNVNNLPVLDSLTWPLYQKIESGLDFNEVELPVFILDFEVNKFTENAEANGNIIFDNNQFKPGVNPTDGIETKHLFYAGAFLDSVKNDETNINLKFDNIYVLSNRNKSVDYIECSVNQTESFTLYDGETFNIKPYLFSKNNLHFTLHYTDGETLTADFRFIYEPKAQTKTLAEYAFFDVVDYFGPSFSNAVLTNPRLRYCIKYGCGNYQLRKPVIFVAGFNMSSESDFATLLKQKDCKELYDSWNLDNMMDELLLSGHDIIIVRFIPAVADIKKNADKLIELINWVNTKKMQNNSYIENMIVGYSSGAIVTRYALDKMEYEHLNSNGPHHHTKLYMSFEGEQQGANISLGIQCLTQNLNDNSSNSLISTINYMANSPHAKQLLIYYKGADYNTQNTGQSADPLRVDLLNDFNTTLGHSKQIEKYGYHGYPAFCRTAVVSDGSRKTQQITPPSGFYTSNLYRNPLPYSFYPGHIIFQQTNTHKYWQVVLNDNSQLYGGIGNMAAFVYEEENIWGNVVLTQNYYTDYHLRLYDYAPGGFLFGGADLNKKILNKAYFGTTIPGHPDNNVGDQFQYRQTSFTPTVSVLDIRNFTPTNYQLHYDLWEHNLMRFTFSADIDNSYYGYPHLGHPANHYSITPFEAIYCDNYNETHIESSAASNVTQNGYVLSTSNALQPFVNDFLFTEFMYKNIYLQNQQVGWNTNGSEYKAHYEAQEAIVIGEKVTPKTDIAPYEILSNGNISCQAKESVTLKPGFYAKSGSEFHAYIQPPTCIYLGGGPSAFIPVNQTQNTSKSIEYALVNEVDHRNDTPLQFVIVPNPNNGSFTLQFNKNLKQFKVNIFDLSGKIVYSNNNSQLSITSIGLQKGVYVVVVVTESEILKQKLIIQ